MHVQLHIFVTLKDFFVLFLKHGAPLLDSETSTKKLRRREREFTAYGCHEMVNLTVTTTQMRHNIKATTTVISTIILVGEMSV